MITPSVDLSGRYFVRAVQAYPKDPKSALLIVAIRHGILLAPDRDERALEIIKRAQSAMAKGAA